MTVTLYMGHKHVTRRKRARIRRWFNRARRGPVCSYKNAVACTLDPAVKIAWFLASRKRHREEQAGLWDERTGQRLPGSLPRSQ